MKQTAIEFLISQMLECAANLEDDTMQIIIPRESFIKATEMEKEQIIETYIAGSFTGCGCYDYMEEEDGELYYKETYNLK